MISYLTALYFQEIIERNTKSQRKRKVNTKSIRKRVQGMFYFINNYVDMH